MPRTSIPFLPQIDSHVLFLPCHVPLRDSALVIPPSSGSLHRRPVPFPFSPRTPLVYAVSLVLTSPALSTTLLFPPPSNDDTSLLPQDAGSLRHETLPYRYLVPEGNWFPNIGYSHSPSPPTTKICIPFFYFLSLSGRRALSDPGHEGRVH